jgi:hypothetical protein
MMIYTSDVGKGRVFLFPLFPGDREEAGGCEPLKAVGEEWLKIQDC